MVLDMFSDLLDRGVIFGDRGGGRRLHQDFE
jgi:hypothetical protein